MHLVLPYLGDYLEKHLEEQTKRAKPTQIDLTSRTSFPVDSQAGRFLVSCDGVEPYLDGHRVTLEIGNPFNATFSGFELAIRFGRRPPTTTFDPSTATVATFESWRNQQKAWENSLRLQEVSFLDELPPGSWKRVEAILSPSKPDEVGYVDLLIKTDIVTLKKYSP
ncbi:MAG: DUF3251 domain-containing protein [Verrucomicrobiae bacterium]|nr:DUF3251 domain-containing protein [Verrucomicrobiae bacterium]